MRKWNNETVWWINTALSTNAGLIMYALISIGALLLHFEATEPAAAGFTWITALTFFVGTVPTIGHTSSVRRFAASVSIQLLGVGLQAHLISCHWQELHAVAMLTKAFRATVADQLLGGHVSPEVLHLAPVWVVWALLTTGLIMSTCRTGQLVAVPGHRPFSA